MPREPGGGGDGPRLKRHLLAMLGGALPPRLGEDDWQTIAAMAAQHRLGPLLAWQVARMAGDSFVPTPIAEAWQRERHAAAVLSLPLHRALREACSALDAADIPHVVLKGPRLAWRCYPEPALRPMRDLDVLVGERDALSARDVLEAADFEMQGDEAVLAEALVADKHLPPFIHASLGVRLELHHRLSEPPGAHGYHVPQLDAAGELERREAVELAGMEVPCQSPTDLLAHLIVHALYGHRLDCGPLVLADIHFLLAKEVIDQEAFRRTARDGGWARGAALLLALTERYFGPEPVRLEQDMPPQVLAAAEEALLQDFQKRDHIIAMTDLLAAGSASALAGTIAGRLRPAAHVVAREGRGAPMWRFWPRWALGRLARLGGRLLDRRAAREGRQTAALLRWLQER
jgi:hypothetical protein